MAKDKKIGTFVKRLATGMLETEKGDKFFHGQVGDFLMKGENGFYTMTPDKAAKDKNDAAEMAAPDVLTGTGEGE